MFNGQKVYIAGPMSGLPEFNFPAFFAAQDTLEDDGWHVFNPANKEQEKTLDSEAFADGDAEKAAEKGFSFRKAFSWDVLRVIEGDAIYMLRGWEASPGARGEHAVAVAMKRHYPDYRIMYE